MIIFMILFPLRKRNEDIDKISLEKAYGQVKH